MKGIIRRREKKKKNVITYGIKKKVKIYLYLHNKLRLIMEEYGIDRETTP